ncbi:hypothetical protein [Psychromonas sp. MME2]
MKKRLIISLFTLFLAACSAPTDKVVSLAECNRHGNWLVLISKL